MKAINLITLGMALFLMPESYASGEKSSQLHLESLEAYKHITFSKITPTEYVIDLAEAKLSAKVNSSSSALLYSFQTPALVTELNFNYMLEGSVATKSPDHERTKGGDDFPFRIGFLRSGPAPTIPFLAPSWIKAIRSHVKHPSDALIYVIAGAKSAFGEKWPSPYSASISNRVISCTPLSDDLKKQKCSHTFENPILSVGYWIMADGDDTKSSFVVTLSDLKISVAAFDSD